MDMIPHGDQRIIEGYRTKEKPKQVVQLILVDLALCIAFNLFWLIKFYNDIDSFFLYFMALAGSLLPDFLVGVHEIYPRMFKRFAKWHFWVHDRFPTKKIGLPLGLMIQIAMLVILLSLYNF